LELGLSASVLLQSEDLLQRLPAEFAVLVRQARVGPRLTVSAV
jgi:hypothetical protein